MKSRREIEERLRECEEAMEAVMQLLSKPPPFDAETVRQIAEGKPLVTEAQTLRWVLDLEATDEQF